MKLVKIFLSLIPFGVLAQCLPFINEDGRPVVDASQGRIIGINSTQQSYNILAYRGIPYAEPPLGSLRFMAPVGNGNFSSDLNASSNPTPCVQTNGLGSEDCLYLNIYTPESALSIGNIAVLVYIHGGAFGDLFIGRYDQVYPLVSKDVIVVLIQFRVGVIGFLSTEDESAPGNQGLMDQTLALHWIKENIEAFGGDSTSITVSGQATGAISTHYQMLSPSAAGLFQKSILKSGNALMSWGMGRDHNETSRSLGVDFGCPLEPSSELVACLQGVDSYNLSIHYLDFYVWMGQPFYFSPRVDGVFLPDEPAILIREGRFMKIPTLTGRARDEAAFDTGEMYLGPNYIDELLNDFDANGPASLQLLPEEDPVNTATAAYEHYLGQLNVTTDNCREVNQMLTDGLFASKTDWFVQVQADMVSTYLYQYDHRGRNSTMDFYASQGLDLPLGMNWVSHSDDNKNMFDVVEPRAEPDDLLVQDTFNTLFTNFVKYGNPTPDDSLGFQWSSTNGSLLTHLSIQTSPQMMEDDRQDMRAFWESLPIKVFVLLQG